MHARTTRHAVLALTIGATAGVIVAIVGAQIASGLDGRAAEGAASASRFLAGIAAIGAAGSAWLALRGRRAASLAASAVAAGLVLTWIGIVAGRGRDRSALVLLESDRSGLEEVVIDGERFVAHRTLGFRLPQPDVRMLPSEEILEDSRGRGGDAYGGAHQLWAFATEDQSLSIVIDLSRAERVSRAEIEHVLTAVTSSVREAGGREVDTDEIEIHDGRCATTGYGAALERGGRIDGRVLAFRDPSGSHRAFHLAITVVGPASANARDYLAGVVVPCE